MLGGTVPLIFTYGSGVQWPETFSSWRDRGQVQDCKVYHPPAGETTTCSWEWLWAALPYRKFLFLGKNFNAPCRAERRSAGVSAAGPYRFGCGSAAPRRNRNLPFRYPPMHLTNQIVKYHVGGAEVKRPFDFRPRGHQSTSPRKMNLWMNCTSVDRMTARCEMFDSSWPMMARTSTAGSVSPMLPASRHCWKARFIN